MIEPWGDLSGHRIRHVVEIDTDRFVLLIQSDSGHRWHIGWFGGRVHAAERREQRFYCSGAGWRDVDGKQYLQRRKVA